MPPPNTTQLERLLEAENDLKEAIEYNPWGAAPSALLAVQVVQKKQRNKWKSMKSVVISSSNSSEEEEQPDH